MNWPSSAPSAFVEMGQDVVVLLDSTSVWGVRTTCPPRLDASCPVV